MDKKKRIEEISNEIWSLRRERSKLEKELIDESNSFEEKFRIWWESDDKIDEDWMIRDNHPLTRNWYENHRDLERHRTYDICDDFEEKLNFILDSGHDFDSEWSPSKEDQIELRAIAQELMDKNLGSFVCDW